MKDPSTRRYIPTQKAMEMRLFEFTMTVVNDGSIHASNSIRVTVRGQIYLINKLLGHLLKDVVPSQMTIPGLA
jgi:phage antirepressor YoqD-like protein